MADRLPAYGTFSGADMIVSLAFPGCAPVVVGEATTLSWSTIRDTGEVRTLGRVTVKGFTRGQRKVAGQIIFTMFNRHMVANIRNAVPYLANFDKILMDELPPFDIILSMANEYGNQGLFALYGVSIIHDGGVYSIEDMVTEGTMMYWARHIEPLDDMTKYGKNLNYSELTDILPKFDVSTLAPGQDLATAAADYVQAIWDYQTRR